MPLVHVLHVDDDVAEGDEHPAALALPFTADRLAPDGPQGVRANCVCPGWVRTPMGDESMA